MSSLARAVVGVELAQAPESEDLVPYRLAACGVFARAWKDLKSPWVPVRESAHDFLSGKPGEWRETLRFWALVAGVDWQAIIAAYYRRGIPRQVPDRAARWRQLEQWH